MRRLCHNVFFQSPTSFLKGRNSMNFRIVRKRAAGMALAVAAAVCFVSMVSIANAADDTSKSEKPPKVDLNTASAKQLQELPGIGEAFSKKIIAARPLRTIKELSKLGIPAADNREDSAAGHALGETPRRQTDAAKKRHGLGQYRQQNLPQGRQPLVRQHQGRQVDDRIRRDQSRLQTGGVAGTHLIQNVNAITF